jgi:hypothetical protein
MKKSTVKRLTYRALCTLLFTALAGTALAQSVDKSVVAEPVAAFPAFNQWVSTVITLQPDEAPASVANVPLSSAAAIARTSFQPLPVIMGIPELPLLRGRTEPTNGRWQPTFNYQGVHMQQVVLPANGGRHELRPMGTPLRVGERFKIRITPTFEAVAEVDQIIGDTWYGQRTGQVYPQLGMSVLIKAGQSVDLPIEANGYFLMNRPANERLLIEVRDSRAIGELRSDQPAYRQDAAHGSSYLQLMERGRFVAIEQLLSHAR